MERISFFSYDWVVNDSNDEEEKLVIDIYGLDEHNKNIRVRVDNFTPYVYVELPITIEWDRIKAKLFEDKLRKKLGKNSTLTKCELVMKKKLYMQILLKTKNQFFFHFFCVRLRLIKK